jgi:hypothetical protein
MDTLNKSNNSAPVNSNALRNEKHADDNCAGVSLMIEEK